MKRSLTFVVLLTSFAVAAFAQTTPVRITEKPQGVVHGELYVPIATTPDVARVELLINGVKWTEGRGRMFTAQVHVGEFLRRMRMRAGSGASLLYSDRPTKNVASAPANTPSAK